MNAGFKVLKFSFSSDLVLLLSLGDPGLMTES